MISTAILIMYGALAFSDPHFSRIESLPNDPGRYTLSWSLPDQGHKTVVTIWLTDGRQRGVWLENTFFGDCDTRQQAFRLVPTPTGWSYEVSLETVDGGLNQVAFTSRDHFGPLIFEQPPDTGGGPTPNPIVRLETDGLTVTVTVQNYAELGDVWLEDVRVSAGVATVELPEPGSYSLLLEGEFGSISLPVTVSASRGAAWLPWVSSIKDIAGEGFETTVYLKTSNIQRRLVVTLLDRYGGSSTRRIDISSHSGFEGGHRVAISVGELWPNNAGSLHIADLANPYEPIVAEIEIESTKSRHKARSYQVGEQQSLFVPALRDDVDLYLIVGNPGEEDVYPTVLVNGQPIHVNGLNGLIAVSGGIYRLDGVHGIGDIDIEVIGAPYWTVAEIIGDEIQFQPQLGGE